jgi:hypothetical protein
MRRIAAEVMLLACVLLVAGGLVLGLTRLVGAQSAYDTFTGRVNRIPVQISSPVYGQVLSLPVQEGGQVDAGRALVTIQVVDRSFRVPQNSQLFKLQGDTLSVLSPVSGIVGRITVAPLSTVTASQLILQLYTPDHTDLHVLVPQGHQLDAYQSFSAAGDSSRTRYPIRLEGVMPDESVNNVSPSTVVYLAKCESTADCLMLLRNQQVLVYAEKVRSKAALHWPPQVSLPFLGTAPA